MSFKEFISHLGSGERVESELIKTLFYSILTGFLTLSILYYLKLKTIENFIPKYGFYLFFVILGYALIMPSIKQVRAIKEMPCMSGMMIGMTTAMISSFLSGFYVASTNGMFIGGFFGIFLGMVIGIYNGKCCGVMGTMEALMASFMGGLMGAMTAFMLLNDNLKIAAVLIFIISAVIMVSLSYMFYLETKEEKIKHKDGQIFYISIMFVLTIITAWLMVYGLRSALFG